jgi:hypothetical protein
MGRAVDDLQDKRKCGALMQKNIEKDRNAWKYQK